MKRSVFVILLILLISACAAPAASSPTRASTPDSTASPSATATATPTETPTETLLPTNTATPTETRVLLSENPTAQEQFAAKQGEIPNVFTFGGHEWTAGPNAKGETVWTREDGKVTFEWASLYGGGRYNAYLFVTRSTPAEGKRTLEIYADPRFSIFTIISGSPSAVDTFVGQTVADVMTGSAAQKILRQPGSTLKVIIGGAEYHPVVGGPAFTRQNISYHGPNGEILWQKIWSLWLGDQGGIVGAFVDSDNNTLQCASLYGLQYWADVTDALKQNLVSASEASAVSAMEPINEARRFDPEQSTVPESGVNLKWDLLLPLLSSEEQTLK